MNHHLSILVVELYQFLFHKLESIDRVQTDPITPENVESWHIFIF